MWSEWDGMNETVERERAQQGGRYPVRLEFPVSLRWAMDQIGRLNREVPCLAARDEPDDVDGFTARSRRQQ